MNFILLFFTQEQYEKNNGFPGGSESKEFACNAGDLGLIPGSGRSTGEKYWRIHSSIIGWKTPWTEEPGGVQSMRSQRVGHDSATNSTIVGA